MCRDADAFFGGSVCPDLLRGSLMRADLGRATWTKFNGKKGRKQVRNLATLGLVALGPVLAVATFLVFGPLGLEVSANGIRLALLADLIYVLAVAALVLYRISKMIAARRSRSAGSRLHLRLTGVFALVALIPTVLVAVFAGLTLNVGLEGWFSERVRQVIGASLEAAEAYEFEQRIALTEDAQSLANLLDAQRRRTTPLLDGDLRVVLMQGQSQIQRGLKEAYVIDGAAEITARGEGSYLFDFEAPSPAQIAEARQNGLVVIEDWENDEFRSLVVLDAFVDRYLLVSRLVDGKILGLLDQTQQTAKLYLQLERERGRMLFEFGLLYLGFAVILILAAIWLGLWFAERLARPVGRLVGAAQRVGDGNLDGRVREEEGDDEIAVLGRVFNQMTRQLKGQRQTLLDANQQIEQRRRLFDSVLSSITAGVMGLDEAGRVDFINRSGARLLALGNEGVSGRDLSELAPEFAALLDRLRLDGSETAQEELKLRRGGIQDILLVRMAVRRGANGELEGFVVAFDDVTDLVSAQRMAAWGDVARRIAHEIKNPLTPIQLSAERIKRKFCSKVGEEDAVVLGQLTDVIVRQTGDLRRIVDEFSKFARMPQPEASLQDLCQLVQDAVVLQATGYPGVRLTDDLPTASMFADLDPTLTSQALINLTKNAIEATQARASAAPEGPPPEVRVQLERDGGSAILTIDDNGGGFPPDRAKLFEPYVTTRDGGTGLGLSIVKKIVEEQGGRIRLEDAPPFAPGASSGARVTVTLPLAEAEISDAAE